MSDQALESQGMQLLISDAASPEVYSVITDITNIDGPGGSGAVIDTTAISDSAKTKRMGLHDEGQVSFTMNYVPANVQHALLRSRRASRTLTNFRMFFTDSPRTQWDFSGYVLGFAVSNGVDAVTEASVTIEVTGTVTES